MRKHQPFQNPQIDISFNHDHHHLHQEESRLNIQLLRVQAADKQKNITYIWSMNQQQLCQYFTNYLLFPTIEYRIENLLDSRKLKLVKAGSKIYFGQIYGKKKEGFGIYIHQEGKIYQGQFVNNEKCGKGVEIYANGNLYIGNFLNNKKHGQGVFYWHNISAMNQNNHQKIECYQGQWWAGLPHGFGTHNKINGDIYNGTFQNGLKHGQGSQKYANGDYYKGQYINGLPQGFGEYLWQDGSSYKGDFKQGERSGYGVWVLNKNGDECYQGHYLNDKKVGYGVYIWGNGWCYKGNFDNDYRDGYGQLYQANRQIYYKGFWSNGVATQKQKYSNSQQLRWKRADQSSKSRPYERKCSEKGDTGYGANIDIYQQNFRSYGKQHISNYATISQYGQSNLCKRPSANKFQQFATTTKNSKNQTGFTNRPQNNSRSVRIRQGRIGTPINRPFGQSTGSLPFKRR